MNESVKIPILNHLLEEDSAFTARDLVTSVRESKSMAPMDVPALCILEFDGDLTDWIVEQGLAERFEAWPCFHTTMHAFEMQGLSCGIIPRTIGGPYAVLIAEQLAAAGVKLIIGLTSAGRVLPELPLPCLVTVTAAIRDEGTSLHYLPASRHVVCPSPALVPMLEAELEATGWTVRRGTVWTTDAPYRETRTQLAHRAAQGVLAVEMQAASLFAFGFARGVAIGCIARVSNAVDHDGQQFDTGSQQDGWRIVQACARSAKLFLAA